MITRSKVNKRWQEREEEGGDALTVQEKKRKKKGPMLVLKLQKPIRKKEAAPSDDDEDDLSEEDMSGDELSDEEFEVPDHIMKNRPLKKRVDRILEHIQKKTVHLEDILQSSMRLKHKAELFELYYIFENSMLNSEERMELRKTLYKTYKEYQQEYKQFVKNKEQIRRYEKSERKSSSILDLQYSILKLQTTDENKDIIFSKFLELKEKSERDEEYYKLKKWINYALDLPYDRVKEFPHEKENLTNLLRQMKSVLDEELYGMTKVKEQILLFMHHKFLFPQMKGCCMGLVGPPGVGKTTIARCIARILDFPFQQISFGGVHNTETLKGFDYTYIGSQPGEIAKCLIRMKHKNGILFLDEYEKISNQNDIVSYLLHITDFSQNNEYRDNYLNDLVIDLSSIWFIYSMNELPDDKALQDRIFTVYIEGYSFQEKVRILVDFLFPRILRAIGLKPTDVEVSNGTATHIINSVSSENEKGIRTLERAAKDIVHKISFIVMHGDRLDSSFYRGKKLEYPVCLSTGLVDTLLKDFKKEDRRHEQMYL